MATYFYNADAEAYRKSILRSNKATIGLPSNVFPVKTDDGDDIYLSTAIFTKAATIVVSTLDCKPGEKFTYTVLVTNQKAPGESSAASLTKEGAKKYAKHVAKEAAKAIGGKVGAVAGLALSKVVGGVLTYLSADDTGMGASLYHTVQHIKSAAGRQVQLFIGGEKA